MPINNLWQIRKGTSSEWSNVNPILSSGEPGFDYTINILKIGDGITPWSGLYPVNSFNPYLSAITGYELLSISKDTFTVNPGYLTGNLEVYFNGFKLLDGYDYTANNGSTFTLSSPGASGDVVEWVGLNGYAQYAQVYHNHIISDISGLQTALDAKQPSGIYASGIHYHSSADITDFNSSVSGLIPSFSGTSGVTITNGGTSYIFSLTDPTIQLADITDLSIDARSFLSNSSSNNLLTLITNETGSGVLVFNDSPSFTGIPTVPTAPSGTNSSQIASTSFVRTEISNLVNSAPSTLDTLNELAIALGNDANFATTITNSLAGKAAISGAIFTGPVTIPSGTGNFNILTVNDTPVSTSGHTHTSSQITDFNSSVSGLLPVKDIIAGSDISVSSTSGIYTISNTMTSVETSASVVTTVFNKTGASIPKMTAVYINGGQGDLPTIQKALATADISSAGTYGITYEAIDNMSSGRVIVLGALTGLNTDQFNPTAPAGDVNGSVVYLSPTVSGGLTTNKPYAPYHIVAMGTIVRTHQNEGVIEVRVQNGYELEELHNVAVTGAINGQFLQYNGVSGLWIPSSSGNFTTLQLNGTTVSVTGHTHTSSDITDFNTSVSGLLPTIANSGDNRILTSTGSSVGINAEANLTFDGTLLNVVGGGSFSSQTVFASGTAASPGISIVGDTDTGIGQLSANGTNSLSIMTSGVERVTINSAGNIGIGTSSPNAKLEIQGSSGVYTRLGTTSSSFYVVHNGTTDTFLYTQEASPLRIGTSATERLRITSGGNLEIKSNAGNISTLFTYNENGGELVHYDDAQVAATLLDQCNNQTRLLELINGSDLLLGLGGSNTTGSVRFMRAGFSEIMRINSSGNIGIGSSTNNDNIRTRLQVCGPDADDDPSLGSGTGALLVTNSDSAYGMQFGVSSDGVGWIQQGRVDGTATAYNLLLNPVGGNVGIGTSPSVRLHISRDTADIFRLQNTAANGGTWDFKVGGGGFQNKNLIITRRTDGVDSADLIINNTGNVGIAAEPVADYKLFVNGGLRSDSATAYPSIIGIKSLTNTSTGTNLESATYGYTTTNGSYALQGLVANIYHKIDSGRTNSASAITFVNNNLRNFALTNDAGTIAAIVGIYNQFGHYNNSAVSPTTTDAIGFNSLFWRMTGTITNAYDIYCQDISSGATVTNRWGIYVAHTGKNFFAGNVGIGAASTSAPEVLSVMQDNNGGRTSILIDNLDQRLKMSCYYQAGVGQYAEIQGFNNAENDYTGLVLNRLGGSVGVGVVPNHRFDVRGSGTTSATVSFHVANSTPTSLFYTRDDGAINTGTAAVSPYNNVTGTAANVVVGSDGFLYRSTSSLRYKTQINDATHGLNEVLKLRSVTFKSQNDGNKIFGGLIAEEVDSAGLTEFVQYDSENRPDAIHYSNMVSLLIKAIQEQQTQINELKNRLSALEGA